MDFTPTEEQAAARDLAARIFGDLATHERLTAAGTGSDAGLWKELCAAGLVAAVEDTGLLGLVLLLEEQGRTTAQVPFAASCVYGLLAVAAHGSPEQRERLLPGIADGTLVVAGAISGSMSGSTPGQGPGAGSAVRAEAWAAPDLRGAAAEIALSGPETVASGSEAVASGPEVAASGPEAVASGSEVAAPGPGSGGAGSGSGVAGSLPVRERATGRLTGVVPAVPWLRDATHVLVADDRRRLWLVRTAEAASEPVELTAPWSAGRLTLDGTPGEALGGEGAFDDLLATARTAFAGLQAGVCAGSLARAVEYTNAREQFGRPLAAKQGVQLRAADAYMDTEAIRVTAYEAAWRRDEGLPYATHALTAAWWASEAGQRVVHTGQHLHGGAGADIEHPVHRHFLWGRQLDAYLGCGGEVLQELGELIANGEVGT
ncbi:MULTISPECIES: acyl-CoA dehydrogenase family protein [unclassified Streptomyces]|uniref:acyl-CoA dehydrogenase family protein n=1 Tax=unclassified Streptomyces TaxID=2593676 RepID=UPI002251FD8A|nr:MULTISPECIES: acyl-CoA dehydrogenase family protein [unclassified Streptomyces]MCX4989855.1 acyl-CoA/acyl-ACP dehydrogenase [Streptomyces sp. NBC_00568]MCX5004905.1 acyl-CoA/acyl-ACP dehydrogenase [Streptomyces sp. NBC_00638]